MSFPTLLMATWRDGLVVLSGEEIREEFAGKSVCGLTRDGHGGALAIVDGRTVYRGTADGEWRAVARSAVDLSCCIAVGDEIFAGSDDARVLSIDIDADVHQVCAHPARPDLVAAAAAVGLCVSRDAGATWTIEQECLHAPHCSAVAFAADDILISAST